VAGEWLVPSAAAPAAAAAAAAAAGHSTGALCACSDVVPVCTCTSTSPSSPCTMGSFNFSFGRFSLPAATPMWMGPDHMGSDTRSAQKQRASLVRAAGQLTAVFCAPACCHNHNLECSMVWCCQESFPGSACGANTSTGHVDTHDMLHTVLKRSIWQLCAAWLQTPLASVPPCL
jgi:hypothetical protein